MNLENAKTQMLKGLFEYCVLSLLKSKDMYASEIIEEFSKTKLDLVEGTIYTILTRLKNSDFLTYYWQESKSGPPRKYFKITDKGIVLQLELSKIWLEIEYSIKYIINK